MKRSRLVAAAAAAFLGLIGQVPLAVLAAAPVVVDFGSVNAEQQFVVPNGVTTIHVHLVGGAGGTGGAGAGGHGADVAGDLTVTPGSTLYVEVAGNGKYISGGFNGGGMSFDWGGGGGASDVRTTPRAEAGSLDTRLAVAAGAGGGGSSGAGGDAGSQGSPNLAGTALGGGAGSDVAGGAGGSGCASAGCASAVDGGPGSLGQGGSNVSSTGGGGGGAGLYGGGSGGTNSNGGAGGGGGSSLVPNGGTLAIDDTGVPKITISYTPTSSDATPAADVSPTSLAFGNVAVGSPSASQQVTVSNTGSGDLHLGQLGTVGTNAVNFGIGSDQCSNTSVAPGASCTLLVTFLPTARGPYSATLQIPDDAADSPQTVALSGVGVGPVAQVTPSSIDFGTVSVGTTSATQTVTITNTGDTGQDLVLTADSISGPNAADFAFASEHCVTNGLLAAGASCTIELSFTPSARGSRSATLSITDNAADSPQTVSLTGTGGTPSADLAVSIAASLMKAKGVSSVTYTITVLNAGPSTATDILINDALSSQTTFVSVVAVDGSCVTPAAGASGVVSCSSASLASGSSTEIQIVVTVIAKKASITNTVTVSATTSDPNLANNTASITTQVK